MTMSSYGSFREIIRDELKRRCQASRAYPLRSFSRDLGLSPATISEALNGISRMTAQKVAAKLAFSDAEAEYFVNLSEKEGGRSLAQKEKARED